MRICSRGLRRGVGSVALILLGGCTAMPAPDDGTGAPSTTEVLLVEEVDELLGGGYEVRELDRPVARLHGEATLEDAMKIQVVYDPIRVVSLRGVAAEASVFLPRHQGLDVCGVFGDPALPGQVLADCSSWGTHVLSCPGAWDDGFCRPHGDDLWEVRSATLGLVWARERIPEEIRWRFDDWELPRCEPCDEPGREPCEATCGGGAVVDGYRWCSAITGCFSSCEPPRGELAIELCNGRDDDCDGVVDNRVIDCTDEYSCTADLCVDGECQHVPQDIYCGGEPWCVTGRCLEPPPATGSGGDRLLAMDPETGCIERERDSWCENVWDRCACNGAERCVSSADRSNRSGCVTPIPSPPSGPNNWPCESDSNNCTFEPCCDQDPGCRRYREISPVADRRRAIEACAGAPGTGGTDAFGRQYVCVNLDPLLTLGIISASDLEVQCPASLCSAGTCDPATGTCSTAPVRRRIPVRGCGLDSSLNRVYVNSSCGAVYCDGSGGCTTEPVVGLGPPRSLGDCSGDPFDPGGGSPSCFRRKCTSSGRCAEIADSTLCPTEGTPETCNVVCGHDLSLVLNGIRGCRVQCAPPI